jgi:hypothetical protein
MKPMTSFVAIVAVVAGVFAACSRPQERAQEAAVAPSPEFQKLQAMIDRFAPVDITADLSGLPANEQQALAKLVEAGWVMDALFLRQVWGGNEAMLSEMVSGRRLYPHVETELRVAGPSSDAKKRAEAARTSEALASGAVLHYFLINKGPWSRLDGNAPFIPGVPPKPDGANFYPAGATKADVEAWLKTLSPADRARATGFFTTIRSAGSTFTIVPYSLEYQGELARAAELLREAANLTSQPTLKAFLTKRADAFISNDYYDSDVAWMELDASIEPTIGPYEVYEDEWFNCKAAFEAFITIRDEAESAKLVKFGGQLQDIEDHLPIDPKYRNPKLGGMAPIAVVNELLASGDGNRGVQTAAFNLPNDERIVKEKGAKRVMLRNVQEAKFRVALVPISKVVLAPADQSKVAFDPFFTHTVMHELMHGLGPHQITVGGRATTVRQELKETYSAIEEAKADISGLFALQYLIDKGVIDKSMEAQIYDTFLASAFRAIRFGVNEAHGKGIALQLNYLTDDGSFVHRDGTFAVDPAKIRQGVTALTHDLLTLEAEGDYAKAKEMLGRLAVVRPDVRRLLDRLTSVPVDIEPRFPTAEKLVAGIK